MLSSIRKLLAERPDLYPGTARFESLAVEYKDGVPHIDLNILSPEAEDSDFASRVRALQRHLTDKIGEQVFLRVEVIPIKILEFEYPPSPTPAGASEATQGSVGGGEDQAPEKAARDPTKGQ